MWAECASTVTKLDNITTHGDKQTIPYEIYHKNKPLFLENMHEFGEIGIIKDYHLKSKLTNKGHHCMLLGHADDHSGNVFRLYDLKTNSLRIGRDIVWLKVCYGEWKSQKDKTHGYNDNNSRYTLNLSEFINNNDNLGSEILGESRDNLDDNVDTVSPQNEIDEH